MPIPQLRKTQGWKGSSKKYYISRNDLRPSDKKKLRRSSGFDSDRNYFFKNIKKKLIIAIILLTLVGSMLTVGLFAWVSRDLPDPNKLIERELAQSTKIYDRTGETVLYEIHGNEKRTLINLDDVPDYVKWATIAIEDKDFYKHGGISLWGIFRGVVWQTIRGKKAQGGSTLTQQFVKNAILTPERKITRKIKEWILSYKLEKKYTKDEILQMYFNEIPYGSNAYGVEAASQKYFGKNAKDLTLAEAAILAALPQAPTRYSPYGSNKELLFERQHYILDLMVEQGYVTEDESGQAKAEKLEFNKQAIDIKAPHFVMYVKEILSEKYGEKMVEQGGLKIITTLDLDKQKIAEEVIAEKAPQNEEKYNATNAALVSIDPKSGQVLAMVGSKDYFNDDIDGQVNITTSVRQPGSSMKPLVYATSFLKGYTPNTILYDVLTNFAVKGADPYEPHNYDNAEHGPVTIRKALAGSLNIPAVKAIYLAGIDNVLDLAQDLGYTTLGDRSRFGLSLVLGGGEVKLLEHTNAFGAFAREGVLHPISLILKVEDRDGKTMEEFKEREKKVLDPKIARMINDILSDNAARAYTFGESNWLTLASRPVAAKTGTTNDYRDAWTMGYTPSIVTGVWVGNNDNTEMNRGAAGGVVAAPIWHDYMAKVLADTPIEEFKKPEIPETGKPILDGEAGTETVFKIDRASGLLATDYTPEAMIEEKTFFDPHCILYYVNKDDPLGDPPSDPSQDPQFILWESRVQEWAKKEIESASSTITSEPPPTEYDTLHVPENLPEIKILKPNKNQTIVEPNLTISINASSNLGVKRAEYYVDNELFHVQNYSSSELVKNVSYLENGFHTLKVRACDDIDNCSIDTVEFNLILDEATRNEQISVKLTSPGNGWAVTNVDFPLPIKFSINQPEKVSKVDVYYFPENNPARKKIATFNPDSSEVSTTWRSIPESGTYKVYAEVEAENNELIKTNEIIIVVNNNSPEEEE